MSSLTNAGLISKRNGKYFLTSFCKVVYEAQILIEGSNNIFGAIDSVESSSQGLSPEERNKITKTLIVEDDLNEILLGRNKNNLVEKISIRR